MVFTSSITEILMSEPLRIFQIYYSQETKAHCFKRGWWHPYDNTGKLTPFFENTVIANLIKAKAHRGAEYFGVFSHDIAKEIVFKENGQRLNPESLRECMESGHDVYSFQKRRQQTNIILQAERYHPGFVEYTERILHKIGYAIPQKLDKIILFNHFIMRSNLYERYVKEMLLPAMKVMATMEELDEDAGYKRKDRRPDFGDQLGYEHYPYHPFICERLPSVWMAYNKDLTFKHIF